jgi:hypothetical protein
VLLEPSLTSPLSKRAAKELYMKELSKKRKKKHEEENNKVHRKVNH